MFLVHVFYFILKALFNLNIFNVLYLLFVYEERRLDQKVNVNTVIYNVTDWTTKSYNTNIVKCLKKKNIQAMKFGQL